MTETADLPARVATPAIRPGLIEHVNLTVSDTRATARMLMDLFGWQVRWEEDHPRGGHVIHVGTTSAYIALYQPQIGSMPVFRHPKGAPLNHIGVEVDDLEAAEARVVAAGLKPFSHSRYDPGGNSFYFLDHDRIEWEVVCYRA